MSTHTGLRERKKAATRATLSQVAMRLALEVGVENVTAEAIAAAADVAPRTFHNYFASKEEAIVAVMVDRARGFADALRARPAGEPVWDALHHAIVAELSGPPEAMAEFLEQMRMLKASRSLRAHHLTVYEEVDHLLSGAIAERTGSDVDRAVYPRLLAAVAAAALKTAVEAWAEDDDRGPSPVALATDALRQLRAGLPGTDHPLVAAPRRAPSPRTASDDLDGRPTNPSCPLATFRSEFIMATFLYRLGRFSFRRRGLVALLWVALLAATVVGAATLSGPTADAFSIPGTESQKAIDQLAQKFPQASAGGATGRVVFAAADGQKLTDPANKKAVEEVIADLTAAPQVSSVADPFTSGAVNTEGTIGYAQVTYQVAAAQMTDAARNALLDSAAHGRDAGLTVEVGGDAVQATPTTGAAEGIGVAVAAVVLLITFGSLIAAGLPLLTALIGIGIGVSAITALTGFVDLSASTSILALMIGLAVAIDYALFIVSRYRHELAVGRDPQEAAGRAVGTAGSAVVFAGLTVIIALVGLSVVGVPFLTQMGLAAASTVAVAVLIALSLLPALLGFAGRRVLGRAGRNPEGDAGGKPAMGLRWARFVTRRPVAVLVLAVLGLGLVAIPATDLRLGLPDDGVASPDTTQRKAYDLLSDGFGAGFNGPLMIVVDTSHTTEPAAAAQRVAETVSGLPDVVEVSPPTFNKAGDTAVLQVIPSSGPNDQATIDLVTAIRAGDYGAGTDVAVTGQTAVNIDMSDKLGGALLPYLLLVVGLAFVLLTLVFRSILVPLKATLGFLLTVLATFGAVVAVFQWGWLADLLGVSQTGPIVSMLPIFLIGIVFGLAMDYEVFLVTRMREEYVHGTPAKQAVVTGFGHGARVVTAAAIIMISVFAGFLLSPEPLIKMMGFALAIGIAFDAFVVRMTIVPAVMALLGRSAWWLPGWLARILPNVDVEGEALRRNLDSPADQPAPELEPARS